MSQGGTVANQLKEALEEQRKLHAQMAEEGLPPAPILYQFGQSQWIHHIMVLTLERLMVEKLGMTQDELKLEVTKTWNAELAHFAEGARQVKSEQLRAQLTQGIRPQL